MTNNLPCRFFVGPYISAKKVQVSSWCNIYLVRRFPDITEQKNKWQQLFKCWYFILENPSEINCIRKIKILITDVKISRQDGNPLGLILLYFFLENARLDARRGLEPPPVLTRPCVLATRTPACPQLILLYLEDPDDECYKRQCFIE
jgi:hypothetical protein